VGRQKLKVRHRSRGCAARAITATVWELVLPVPRYCQFFSYKYICWTSSTTCFEEDIASPRVVQINKETNAAGELCVVDTVIRSTRVQHEHEDDVAAPVEPPLAAVLPAAAAAAPPPPAAAPQAGVGHTSPWRSNQNEDNRGRSEAHHDANAVFRLPFGDSAAALPRSPSSCSLVSASSACSWGSLSVRSSSPFNSPGQDERKGGGGGADGMRASWSSNSLASQVSAHSSGDTESFESRFLQGSAQGLLRHYQSKQREGMARQDAALEGKTQVNYGLDLDNPNTEQ